MLCARARSVLLAALSILPYSAVDAARSEAEAELEKDRSMRVANLLGFSVVRARVHGCPGFDCAQVPYATCSVCGTQLNVACTLSYALSNAAPNSLREVQGQQCIYYHSCRLRWLAESAPFD